MVAIKKLDQIRQILKPKLSKVGQIKTYEVMYECSKAGLEVNYKTAGEALRKIMDEMIFAGQAYQVRMGTWMISKPAEEIHWNVHPIDDKKNNSEETKKRCEAVRLKLKETNSCDPMSILDACTDHGVSVNTFVKYLKERKCK